MTRGNQRELARAKNEKNKPKAKKDDGLSLLQRRERDAQLMREKQQRKDAEKQAKNT